MDRVQASGKVRKRKAESQDNERLSKRLSLLNLERNGQKLYVPVEQPSAPFSKPRTPPRQNQKDDTMELDDTKHKVYIYDLDAELSDSETSDDGRLVFLPDIQKHLRDTRIPPMVLANSEGELAGNNQLVLYNVPSSLTVPEEQDSVRKAIIETRARARARQQEERNGPFPIPPQMDSNDSQFDASNPYNGVVNGNMANGHNSHGPKNTTITEPPQSALDDDLDAMDLG